MEGVNILDQDLEHALQESRKDLVDTNEVTNRINKRCNVVKEDTGGVIIPNKAEGDCLSHVFGHASQMLQSLADGDHNKAILYETETANTVLETRLRMYSILPHISTPILPQRVLTRIRHRCSDL